MSISESMEAMYQEEEDQRAKCALGEYTGGKCEKCGRERVCRCPNGRTRCKKCNWVPEEQHYVMVSR